MRERPLPTTSSAFFEALLFIAERPLTSAELAELAASRCSRRRARSPASARSSRPPAAGSGCSAMDDAWQLATAPRLGARLAAYAAREEARLTPAALEALAVIAYRQPCTRGEVERVRGVDSDYVIRSLLHRRLVAEMGRRDTPGRPVLFGTTFTFLERFGLTRTDDLPVLASATASRHRRCLDRWRPGRGRPSMPAERIQKLLARGRRRLAPGRGGTHRGGPGHRQRRRGRPGRPRRPGGGPRGARRGADRCGRDDRPLRGPQAPWPPVLRP